MKKLLSSHLFLLLALFFSFSTLYGVCNTCESSSHACLKDALTVETESGTIKINANAVINGRVIQYFWVCCRCGFYNRYFDQPCARRLEENPGYCDHRICNYCVIKSIQ